MLRYGGKVLHPKQLGCDITQITKSRAEKYFYQGKTIWLLPCRMTIDTLCAPLTPINENCGMSFGICVGEFVKYNCDKWKGERPMFFVRHEQTE